jgi:TonB family protein
MFVLANEYSGTAVDAVARRRLGFPVWSVEKVQPSRIVYVRPEGRSEDVKEVVLERVEPREVPLPPGRTEVKVWVRVGLGRDGSVEDTKVVKSGGEEFDAACLEAARASRYLAPQDGGADITVVQYVFPRAKDPSAGGPPPATRAPNTSLPDPASVAPDTSLPDSASVAPPQGGEGDPPPPGSVGSPPPPPKAEQPPSLRDRPIERNP